MRDPPAWTSGNLLMVEGVVVDTSEKSLAWLITHDFEIDISAGIWMTLTN